MFPQQDRKLIQLWKVVFANYSKSTSHYFQTLSPSYLLIYLASIRKDLDHKEASFNGLYYFLSSSHLFPWRSIVPTIYFHGSRQSCFWGIYMKFYNSFYGDRRWEHYLKPFKMIIHQNKCIQFSLLPTHWKVQGNLVGSLKKPFFYSLLLCIR